MKQFDDITINPAFVDVVNAEKLATVTAVTNVKLPQVPIELTETLVNFMDDRNIPLDQRIKIIESNFDIKEKNQLWIDWVTANVAPRFFRASIQKITNGDLAPHTDMVRNFCLLYIVKAGGPNVQTKFYKVKPDAGVSLATRRIPFRYSTVDEVESFTFKEGTWNLINNKFIHAVHGLVEPRISFAVDFIKYPSFIHDL
jgi:hypothetical protein